MVYRPPPGLQHIAARSTAPGRPVLREHQLAGAEAWHGYHLSSPEIRLLDSIAPLIVIEQLWVAARAVGQQVRSVPAAWIGWTLAHRQKGGVADWTGRPVEVASQLQGVEALRLHLLAADLGALHSSAARLLELQPKIELHSAARHL